MTPKEEFLEKHNKQVREHLERISSKKTNGGYEMEMQAASMSSAQKLEGISLDDFHAYMPTHSYIYAPSREMWPATSINSRIAPVRLFDVRGMPVLNKKGEQLLVPASVWLDKNKPVEQMT